MGIGQKHNAPATSWMAPEADSSSDVEKYMI